MYIYNIITHNIITINQDLGENRYILLQINFDPKNLFQFQVYVNLDPAKNNFLSVIL